MVPQPDRNARHDLALSTSVYLYYDKHDTLIYVGITDRGIWRNREHDANAEWWRFVARQEVEHLPSREEALRREKELITERQPPFNKQHNPHHEDLKAAYLAWHIPGRVDDVDPENLVRKLNRCLPLTVSEIGVEDRFVLKTLPEHSVIAHRLDGLAGIVVLGPRRIGNVVAQQNIGIHCFILVQRRRGYEPPPLGTAAVAPIRFAGGGLFRLSQIEMAAPAGGAL